MDFFSLRQDFLLKRTFHRRGDNAEFFNPVAFQSLEFFLACRDRVLLHHRLVSRVRADFASFKKKAGEHHHGEDNEGIAIHPIREKRHLEKKAPVNRNSDPHQHHEAEHIPQEEKWIQGGGVILKQRIGDVFFQSMHQEKQDESPEETHVHHPAKQTLPENP